MTVAGFKLRLSIWIRGGLKEKGAGGGGGWVGGGGWGGGGVWGGWYLGGGGGGVGGGGGGVVFRDASDRKTSSRGGVFEGSGWLQGYQIDRSPRKGKTKNLGAQRSHHAVGVFWEIYVVIRG